MDLSLFLSLAVLLFAVLPDPAAGEVPARAPAVVDEVVNIRAGRGVETPRVGRLAPGDRVLAGDCARGWCAVSRPGAEDSRLGFVHASLLKPKAGSLPAGNPLPGAEIILTPGLEVRETYDSNVMFKDVADLETSLRPSLEALLRGERTRLTLRAAAEILRYGGSPEFDRVNRDLDLRLVRALTERAGLDLRARGRFDHSFESVLEETGVVAAKSPRSILAVEPGLTFQADERTALRLGGEATSTRHPDKPETDVQGRGGSLTLTRGLEPGKSSVQARAGHSVHAYEAGRQEVTVLGAGFADSLSETLSYSLFAGPFLSRDRFSTHSGPRDGAHAGMAAEGSARLDYERLAAEFGADLGPVSGEGGENVLRRRVRGRLALRLTERLDAALAGSWNRTRTQGYVRERRNVATTLDPSLEYALGEHSLLRLGWGYTGLDDVLAETYQHRERLFLSLQVEFPSNVR